AGKGRGKTRLQRNRRIGRHGRRRNRLPSVRRRNGRLRRRFGGHRRPLFRRDPYYSPISALSLASSSSTAALPPEEYFSSKAAAGSAGRWFSSAMALA